MDVKAIQSTQTALDMHTANLPKHHQEVAFHKQKREEEVLGTLHNETKKRIISEIVDELNEKLKLFDNSLKIEVDKETKIQVVKIIDNETKRIIRQLPPETTLKIARYIDEITGLLFEKKA